MSVKIYQKLRLFRGRFLPKRLPRALGYAVALFQNSPLDCFEIHPLQSAGVRGVSPSADGDQRLDPNFYKHILYYKR